MSQDADREILITGGAGCLGRAVRLRARLGNQYQIWAPSRQELDLDAPASWPVARLRRVKGAIHLGAIVHSAARSNRASVWRVNVESTRRLVELTVGKPFVFASTFAVYDPRQRGDIDEETPARPTSLYGESKLEAERHVLLAGGTVLRFPVCYGPGDRGNVAWMIGFLKRGGWVFPGVADVERPVLGSANAADAIWLAFRRPMGAEVFGIADCASTSLRTLVGSICALLDKRVPTLQMPAAFWIAASAGRRLAERLPLSLPLPSAQAFANLAETTRVRLAKAERTLHYCANVSLVDGLRAQLEACK